MIQKVEIEKEMIKIIEERDDSERDDRESDNRKIIEEEMKEWW